MYRAIHQRGIFDWNQATDIPKELRLRLSALRPLRTIDPELDRVSRLDRTNKVLFSTADGGQVESVLMRNDANGGDRHTVCISSQIGCPAACSFCASGLGGFMRNLTVAEITDQVEFFAGRLRDRNVAVDNVVYMGMGEPFLNYSRVMASIANLRSASGLNLGARRITVSTVGIVPAIRRFTREAGEVNLAISLHAPNDALRRQLVPYNDHFSIDAIMDAVREYIATTRRRVSFEYVLLQGVNDGRELIQELAALLRPLVSLVHVNLIPWNPFGEAGFSRSTRTSAESFADRLRALGINTTVRYSRGLDIDAACGQLRSSFVTGAVAS